MATRTTKAPRDPSRQRGARTAGDGGGGKKGGGWLWWLLGLLALAALAILLISLLSGDDDPKPSGQATQTQAQQTPAATAPAAGQGSLTAGGESLLPVPSAGLASYSGDPAQGRDVVVQSVVKDEGFWVGPSAQERVYVEYGGDVGQDETDTFVPTVGDRVNLTGPVRSAPQDPAQTLNLPAQDAQMVTEQGAYINADGVEAR